MMQSGYRLRFALLSTLLLFIYSGTPLAAEQMTDQHEHSHAHGHEQEAKVQLSLDHGEKWKTDAALRQGMQKIHTAVMQAVPAYHDLVLTKTDAGKLAAEVNTQVDYLFTNCRLEAGADATLHVLIASLLTAASVLAERPLSDQGLPVMLGTLQLYTDYFDHQGWDELPSR